MFPTPVPPSPSELKVPKVLFRGKLVSSKKANSPFLVYQRYKSRVQNQSSPQSSSSSTFSSSSMGSDSNSSSSGSSQNSSKRLKKSKVEPNNPLFSLLTGTLKYSILVAIISLLLSRMITEEWFWGYQGKYVQMKYYFPGPETIFTIESLSQHDGIKDPSKPILLAIEGKVYDVSSNMAMYGPGGSYNHFCGRDASRAFVTGCFKSGLTYDTRGLNDRQKKSLKYWSDFFENSPKYSRVGRLVLPEIDSNTSLPKDCDPKQEGGAI
ncbi:cytochrome b5-like heme/steroid binding domain-containing protein [Phakopsora pachyrhizi]|nr:cytochrome b5-like heme/steroid binding domain-containing protein [Phakopsora pachyrhizi]